MSQAGNLKDTQMIVLVVIIHVIVSLGLILAILLHSGKGAGLSNVFGGGLPTSFSGTSMIERNLDRITIGLAVTFALTTFILMLSMPKQFASTTAPAQTTTQTPSGGQTPGQTTPGGQTPGGQTPGGSAPAPAGPKP